MEAAAPESREAKRANAGIGAPVEEAAATWVKIQVGQPVRHISSLRTLFRLAISMPACQGVGAGTHSSPHCHIRTCGPVLAMCRCCQIQMCPAAERPI